MTDAGDKLSEGIAAYKAATERAALTAAEIAENRERETRAAAESSVSQGGFETPEPNP